MSETLESWRERYGQVSGWFSDESAALFDSFLAKQTVDGIDGDLFEIGVAHGKSATLLSCHLNEGKTLFLADINEPLLKSIQPLFADRGISPVLFCGSSFDISRDTLPSRTVRFMHVDGDHGRRAQHNDLAIADQVVAGSGLVSLDDFFAPQFSGLTVGAIEWLALNPEKFQLILTGFNKGYLCRPHVASKYLRFIRDELPDFLRKRGNENFTLFRMSERDDFAGFGITPRQWDRDFVTLSTDVTIPEAEKKDKIEI